MKYKKSMIMLVILIFIFAAANVCASDVNDTVIASADDSTVELSQADSDEIISTDENELLSQTENEIISEGDSGTFAELQANIAQATEGSTLTLDKNYKCEDGFDSEGIPIDKSITIDGNGFIIDAQEKSRIFKISSENVVLKNIIFTNGKATNDGGAVCFEKSGTVANCIFTNNYAIRGGAVYFNQYAADGEVTNCAFTNNSAAYHSGAVYFFNNGAVTNCTFTNNSASEDVGGAVYFLGNGAVTNSTFTNNSASDDRGGAVFFNADGTVTNCNFTDNNATTGSAIYFNNPSATKIVSNSLFLNNRANAESLEVIKNDNNIAITFTGNDNLLNAIYSEVDGEVTFTNVTYWSANGISNTGSSPITPPRLNRVTGQNITVAVVVNNKIILNDVKVTDENGMIVLDISVGDNYYIIARHDTDSYYTEVEKTISNNTNFNVNVSSQTTTNKTVNITAKSNIFNEIMAGKLLFLLPNGDEIEANYSSNGTWWAVHEFDKCDVYQINASYVGLDNVTVNNATITIDKVDSTITLDNITLNYGKSKNVTVTTIGATGITAKIDGNNITVINNYTIPISDLAAGNYTLTVTTIPDDDHNPATATSKITVNKVKSTLTVDNIIFDYGSEGSGDVSFTGANEVTANVVNQHKAVVNVSGKKITVSGLDAGNYTLNVTTVPDENHTAVSKTATITVNKINSTVIVNDFELDYGNSINITVTADGATDITAEIDNVNVAVNDYTIPISDLGPGNHTLTVTTIPDENHNPVTATSKITINKVASTLTVDNIIFDYGSEGSGDVSFTGANEVIANVENQPKAVVNVSGKKITVSGLAAGTYVLNVTTVPDENHTEVTQTATITVNKAHTEIILGNESFDMKAIDYVVLTDTLNPAEAGNLTYTSSDENIVRAENGLIMADGAGTAIVTVSFDGNENYTAAESKTIKVTVRLNDASVSVENTTLDLYVDDTFDLNATQNPLFLDIQYASSNKSVATVNDEGIVTAVGEGTATITLTVGNNITYTINSTEVTVTVSKIPTEIKLNNKTFELHVGDSVRDFASLIPEDAGNLTLISSNESVVAVANDEIFMFAYSIGTATVTVSFAGNEKYAAAKNKTIIVNVTLKDASVSVENTTLDLKVGDSHDLNATTIPDWINIDYKSSDETVVSVNSYGIVTAVGEGTATITLTVGNNITYAINSTEVTVNVKKIDTSIDADDKHLDLKVGDSVVVNATLNPEDAGQLNYTSSDVNVITVNSIGEVTAVGTGNATVIVSFAGNDKYSAAESKTIEVTVREDMVISAPDLTKYYNGPERFVVNVTNSKNTPLANKSVSITLNGVTYNRTTDENGSCSIAIHLPSGVYNITTVVDNETADSVVNVLTTVNGTDVVKVFRNATQYYATFRDSEGNYLTNGTMVRFNIHGVMYDRAVSGDEGLVKLNINLEQGEYIITAINPETGEMSSNNITVIPRIIENNDLTKYYRNDSQYTVKIIGDDGNPVGAGVNVTFNINGVFYTRTTNESGIAKLNINLQPGDYVITAEYMNCSVSNKIKVLPVLSADDLTKKYGTTDQFVATLVDGQGNPYANQTVQFNVNGVLYDRVTDSSGQAKLNINLMSGQYIITSSYNGCNISNKITVTA